MNRSIFETMLAQYKKCTTEGAGIVSWENGARCLIPKVMITGKIKQDGSSTPKNPILPTISDKITVVSRGDDPKFDGGTAVGMELLEIPGTKFRDTWEIQTGRVIKQVEKLVLTGAERWDFGYLDSWGAVILQLKAKMRVQENALCSHGGVVRTANAVGTQIQFGNMTNRFQNYWGMDNAVDWQIYLAEQYAAGTPVTLFYPLMTPVEIWTEPQPLTQPLGVGHIIQTGGTLKDCPITVTHVTHQ